MYDVAIIGAGVCGCSAAWELSRFKLNVCVLDRETDICEGTSKANTGVVNAGHDPKPGTLAAHYNAKGAEWIFEHKDELGIEAKNNGFYIACTDMANYPALEELCQRGITNGVRGMRIISREEALKEEPNLADDVVCVLNIDGGGTLSPWTLVSAYAEIAARNGVEFRLGEKVLNVKRTEEGFYELETEKDVVQTKYVINAAGVYADDFNNMVSERKIHIHPRKGAYMILDKNIGYVTRNIAPQPTEMGKGCCVTQTIHGNLNVGPTAFNIEDKEDTSVTQEDIDFIISSTSKLVKDVPYNTVITQYCGLRAEEESGDFILFEAPDSPGFINYAGMKSPGLTCSPLIAVDIRKDLERICGGLEEKESYVTTRTDNKLFKYCTKEEQAEMLKREPAYGRIICRCEQITEGDILNAIHRPVGATTMDGVKRRVRAGMGRCQGGFCSPRVMEILARETGQDIETIKKNQAGSELLVGTSKEEL